MGRLSRHLLERFAVRLSVADLRLLPPPERLLDALPPGWRTAATGGVRPVPVADDALGRLPALLGPDAGVRRELALLRLAGRPTPDPVEDMPRPPVLRPGSEMSLPRLPRPVPESDRPTVTISFAGYNRVRAS